MEDWSPSTMVRYGFSRVDDNGDIVSIWNFAELDRHLKEVESGEDVLAVITSGAPESDSGSTSSMRSDAGFRGTARYSSCPVCAIELHVSYRSSLGPLLASVLSSMNYDGCLGCVDDQFLLDFWTHVMCRFVDDSIPPLEGVDEDTKGALETQPFVVGEEGDCVLSRVYHCADSALELLGRGGLHKSGLIQCASKFFLHIAITHATCLSASVSVQENLFLFCITVEVWFYASTYKSGLSVSAEAELTDGDFRRLSIP